MAATRRRIHDLEVHARAAAPERQAPDARRLAHVPALDGVRGIAVAAVLLFHSPFSWIEGGFLGVSTFFTLSGFLITTLLLREQGATATIDLRSFWVRRARRLLPAAAITIVGVAVASRWLVDPTQYGRVRGDLLSTVFYVANWRFASSGQAYADLFVAPSPVLHFWSLAIEEQFYLVYPLLAYAVFKLASWSHTRFGLVLVVLCAASISAPGLLGFTNDRIYYGTDARAAELLIGGVLAVALTAPRIAARLENDTAVQWLVGLAGTTALGATMWSWFALTQGTGALYRGGLGGYAAVSAILVAGALVPPDRSPVAALLGTAPLRGLGRISYGVYLYHWPIYLWVSPERTGVDPTGLAFIRIPVTIGLAWLSYRYVEQPIRSGRFLADRRVMLAVPGLAVCMALVAGVGVPPAPPNGTGISFAQEGSPPPSPPLAEAAPAAEALPAAPPPPTKVVVVGGTSHQGLVDELAAWSRLRGGPLEVTPALAECGRSRAEIGVEFRTDQMTCAGWVQAWKPVLEQVKPDYVVILQPLVHTTLPAWGDHIF